MKTKTSKTAKAPNRDPAYEAAYQRGMRDGLEQLRERGEVADGVTYDGDPESHLSVMYDLGLNAAEDQFDLNRLKSGNAALLAALEGLLEPVRAMRASARTGDVWDWGARLADIEAAIAKAKP